MKLEINGRIVSVDDSFKGLSPEEQQKTVNEIAASLSPQSGIDAKRVAGLGTRASAKGLIGGVAGWGTLPIDLAYNAAVGAGRATGLTPKAEFGLPATSGVDRVVDYGADLAGLPKPETTAERIGSAVTEAGVGAFTGAGVARNLARGVQNAPRIANVLRQFGEAIPSQTAAGAISGGVASGVNEATGGEHPVLSALSGLLAGPTTTAVGRRVVTPAPSVLNQEERRLANVFQNEVGPLSAGQRTGRTWLQLMEDQASKVPFGDTIFRNPRAQQDEQFAQAALRRGGMNDNLITQDVLNDGLRDVGQRIGNVTRQYNGRIDNEFLDALQQINDRHSINLTDAQQRQLNEYVQRLSGGTGNFTGEAYGKLRSQLGALIRTQKNPESLEYRTALEGLQNAFDDLMERNMLASGRSRPDAATDIGVLNEARQQYSVLKTLGKANLREDGTLTPQALKNAVKGTVGKERYNRGYGQLNDLARAGSKFLTKPASSNTSERNALAAYVAAMVGGGATGGVPGFIGAAALPFVGQTLVNSPIAQRYWRNQLAANPISRLAYMRSGLLGGAAGANQPGILGQ